MSFSIIELAGTQTLITGTDYRGVDGEQVVDNSEWNNIKARARHDAAHDAFDEAQADFFAPLIAAMDELESTYMPQPTLDPYSVIVLDEGEEAVEGRAAEIVALSQGSIALRVIEDNPSTDRLIWVNERLVLTADTSEAEELEEEDISDTPVFDRFSDAADTPEDF